MKGYKICFGVLLALATIFMSLFAGSSAVNAYKYDLNYIPFTYPEISANNGVKLNESFMVEGYEDQSKTIPRSLKDDQFYYDLNRNDINSKCNYVNQHPVLSNDGFRYYIPYYLQPEEFGASQSSIDVYPWYACQTNLPLNDSLFARNDFIVLNIPNKVTLTSYYPYRFKYDGAFLRSRVTTNGLDRQTKFQLGEVYDDDTDLPDWIFHLRLPFGTSKLHFHAGDTISFRGTFYLDSDDVSANAIWGGGAELHLLSAGFASYNEYLSNTAVSTFDTYDTLCAKPVMERNSNPDEAPFILSYQCDVTVDRETNISGFTLDFRNPNSGVPVIYYKDFRMMIFDSSIVVTNNDMSAPPTDQSFQSGTVHSNNLNDVPGFAGDESLDAISNGVNWTESLKNLFNFNILNPFAPLFGLFINQNRCVNIPTLSGMLHSTESTVCPWFDSTVRGIVTPVLGISSIMLLFGFIVRWLGARSGNFIEDSGGVDAGGFHLQNKYRRGK